MLRSIVSRSRAVRFLGATSAVLCGLVAAAPVATAETGIASIYSSLGVTASGRSYSTSDSVAAHKTLPLGSIVLVENLRNGRTATVTIVDRGPGLSDEDKQRAMRRFWRGTTTTPGTGLGLPIAQRIIELHGGQIKLDSSIADRIDVTMMFPASSAPRHDPNLDIQQAQRYARDLAKLLARRHKRQPQPA